jgi:N-acetyl sugar amidotransferase
MQNKDNLKRCNKCQLPETYETIEFDSKGECNICASSVFKNTKIDWKSRKKQLDKIIEENRNKYSYDCIIPFSGGKDSVFTLNYLIKEYKIKPLVVRFNHGFIRKTIQDNVHLTLKKLGVDFIDFTPNWKIVKKVMLEAFKRKTDFCWHCHTGIYSYPIRVALMYKVPLIFYGEPLGEFSNYYDYEADKIDLENEEKFLMLRTLGITAEDMHGMINKSDDPIDIRDLSPYTYPDIDELKKLKYNPVCLGSFIPWDHSENTKLIKKELGWKNDELEGVPDELNEHGEKIECFMQGTRDYVKYLKRGYSRVSQINSLNVRNNRMTPGEAKELNEKFDGRKPHSLEVFLEYVGLSEEEFNQIVDKTVIHPNKPNYKSNEIAKKTKDFDDWYRENNKKK